MGVTVSGLRHLLDRLEKAGNPAAMQPALKEAVREGAQLVFDAVHEECPESTDKWTPKSTSLKPGQMKEGLTLIQTTGDRGNPTAIVTFEKDVRHVARWVEKGHRMVVGGKSKLFSSGKTRGKGHELRFIPGSHFFVKAVEGKEDDVRAVVRNTLKKRIDEILKG